MDDAINKLNETMRSVERLLKRYELDMAGRLHAADDQAMIAMLCEQFELQMRALLQPAFGGDASMRVRSESHGFSMATSRTESGERS